MVGIRYKSYRPPSVMLRKLGIWKSSAHSHSNCKFQSKFKRGATSFPSDLNSTLRLHFVILLHCFPPEVSISMEKAPSLTASAVNHAVTVAATTMYQTLTHTAAGRIKTITMVPSSTPTSAPAQVDPSAQIAQLLSTWPRCIVSRSQSMLLSKEKTLTNDTATGCLCRHLPQVVAVQILNVYVPTRRSL